MNEQLNIFSVFRRDFRINNKIRLIELFAGVGSQAMALKRLGTDFEHYKVVEFDKYAVKSYNAIHGTDFEPTDITQISGSDLKIVDTETFTYLLTYSFPCQDLSVAGKQKGMVKGSGTRSGLLWEVERLLNEVGNLPQVLLMENVPQVHGKKNIEDFQKWIAFLESKGYSNYWQDLNAKNYGVAQNRNRCFMVSILGNYNFTFPNPIELQKVMKDYLEDEVDEKYYINNRKAQKLIQKLIDNGTLQNTITRAEQTCVDGTINEPREIETANCISARTDRGISNHRKEGNGVVAMRGRNPDNPSDRIVGSPTEQRLEVNMQGTSNCLTSVQKDNLVLEKPNQLGFMDNGTGQHQSNTVYDEKALCPNITTVNGGGTQQIKVATQYRIRKLTPKECWRLMDFSDEDFENAEKVNSNTQLYKQAGNSIVVNVLVAILGQLLQGKEDLYKEII